MDGFCLQGELDLTLFVSEGITSNYSAPPVHEMVNRTR